MRVALLLLLVAPAVAQPEAEDAPEASVDVVVLQSVQAWAHPAAVGPLRVVNHTAYPVFLGAAPALGAGAWLADADLDPAVRLAVAETITVGLTLALKSVIRRPRPYAAVDGIQARDRGHQGDHVLDPHSFPSGHASTAAAIATSLSLSYPEWYVVGPAVAWATTMGVARVWHGVHYPSDVVAGTVLGLGTAVVVHLVMPDVFEDEPGAQPVRIVVPL